MILFEADAARRAAWSARLGPGFKVGISWQGSPTYVHDRVARFRSPLGAAGRHPGNPAISLQKHPDAEQIATVPFAAHRTGARCRRYRRGCTPRTAALVASLDLVVTSESMTPTSAARSASRLALRCDAFPTGAG